MKFNNLFLSIRNIPVSLKTPSSGARPPAQTGLVLLRLTTAQPRVRKLLQNTFVHITLSHMEQREREGQQHKPEPECFNSKAS